MKNYVRITALLVAALSLCACTPVQDMLEQETADLTPPPKDPLNMTDIPDYMSMPLDEYVTLGAYTGKQVKLEQFSLSDAQVEDAIREIKKLNGKFDKVTDRLVAWGDTLVMSYTASVQGDEGSSSGKDVEVTLGENDDFSEEFLRNLVGAPCNIPVTLTVEEQSAGQTVLVNYQVTVSYIIGDYHELTDEFVATYTGGECTDADAFFAYYKEQMWNELYYETVYDALWDACVADSRVNTVPDEAVQYYMDSQEQYYRAMAAKNHVTYEAVLAAFELSESKMRELSVEYATKDLIFYAIVKDADFALTGEQYDKALHDYAVKYFDSLSAAVGKGSGEGGKVTVADVKAYLDAQQRNTVRELCYDDMMYDYLYQNNQIFVGDVPMN